MQFSYTPDRIISAANDIPRPEDLTNDLSGQDEHDIVEILDTVGSCLRRNGNRHDSTYTVSWARPVRWRADDFSPERVLAEVSRLIADECGWDVVFNLENASYVSVTLSRPEVSDIDQLDLF